LKGVDKLQYMRWSTPNR